VVRKSPVRHHVKHHIREHRPVRDYNRGRGQRSSPFLRRTVLSSDGDEGAIYCKTDRAFKAEHCEQCGPHELRSYRVQFRYEDGNVETVKTNAHSPTEAHEHAEHIRSRLNERPTEVIVRNSLGDIVGKLGAGMKKLAVTVKPYAAKAARVSAQLARKAAKKGYEVGKKGAKLAGKGVKAGVKATSKAIVKYARDRRSAELLKDTQSADIVKRTRARQRLKRDYPDIYEEAGLGTPKSIVELKSTSERDLTPSEYLEEAKQLAKVHKAKSQ
jgi:hypothetical protein